MSAIIRTESHGEIEAGFYASFNQFATVGEYAFATRDLCDLTKHLAEHPEVERVRVLGYDENKFWTKFQESNISDLAEMLAKDYGLRLVENHAAEETGTEIPVGVAPDGRNITIGQYRISAPEFGIFAYYIAHGGLGGWGEGKVPDFAESTLEAIKHSKNPLFKYIQQKLGEKF